MKRVALACLSFAIGALTLLALAEGLLRLLPVSRGLDAASDTSQWPLRAYEPHRRWTYSNSWAMLNANSGTTNNYGHLAPHDYRPGSRPLIVVGDSYIESQMNAHADSLQGILGAELGAGRPVYGLGLSGLSLSDYVVLARQARSEFAPAAAVVLVSDGDIAGSLAPRPGGFHLLRERGGLEPQYTPLSPSPVMAWVREHWGGVALYAYLRNNLKFSPADVVAVLEPKSGGALPPRAASADADRAAREIEVAHWFVEELPRVLAIDAKCIVLLLDADRFGIYDPTHRSHGSDTAQARRALAERGRALGLRVVDLEPLFRAEYARTRLKFDHWPIDRHWNRAGHALAADAVMSALYSDAAASACRPGEPDAASTAAAR